MSLHTENNFEDDICDHLGANDWLYSPHEALGDAAHYDSALALYPADVVAWVQVSQPKSWGSLVKTHGASAEKTLLERIRRQLDERGTLDVLRFGVDMLGLRGSLQLAQFKPALGMNPELQANYAANRLRVVRQVRTTHGDIIDLVLFVNGLPVATAELKSEFTQGINEAVEQYRNDRQPRPKGKPSAEPLLDFPRGALVHFAVTNRTVMMTTKLEGLQTRFLPFNLGDNGAAGNPVNPLGNPTAYLWEQVWARESWLEILGRYVVTQRNDKKQISGLIFPRYHQLDATRKLIAAIQSEVAMTGVGQKYLIQHSAGSGKTNSIAWTAHFLADLHDANHQKVFNTVLVVSDRTVLDTQLQEAIFDFERTTGVVATIKGTAGSKSAELAEALSGGKKIVVCTIQTFPFALKAVQELAATQGKRFAVIADEAHSSQTGEAASKLKETLNAQELADLDDGGEVGSEDILAALMSTRAAQSTITYVAFTATPKAKTLELFGRRPNPALPAGADNLPAPFHVYSMRQAIEEGFILDVLKNYTPYKVAFKLANDGKEYTDDTAVDRSEAMKGIMRWVRLHPYNISQKVQVVVEHFRENVAPLLAGKAKAMVVLGSRVEAVRWQLAIDSYIKSQGYKLGTLVAFSGDVAVPDLLPEPVSEFSKELNPNLKGRDIREAFNGDMTSTDEYQILLVANKFQTGFDQPLLCGMYVDKRLGGVQAVQTLSRLNRAHPGKDTTYVLDFVNDPDEVLAEFKKYFDTAELAGVTDPHIVYDLRAKLDAMGHYDDFEVERVVLVELNLKATQSMLVAAIEPVADRLLKQYKAALLKYQAAEQQKGSKTQKAAKSEMDVLVLFKANLGAFLRVYAFLGQIFDYGNTAIEKRAIFYKRLMPLLEFGREREGVDLSKVTLTHHKLTDQGQRTLALHAVNQSGADYKLQPMTETGGGEVQEKQKLRLSEIIEKMNDLFEGDLTEGDQLSYFNTAFNKIAESEELVQQSCSNSKEQFSNSPDLRTELVNALMDAFAANSTMSRQALDSERVREGMINTLLGPGMLYEFLRNKGQEDGRVAL